MLKKIIFYHMCALLMACSSSAPEEIILGNIASIQEAIEERQSGDAMDFLGEDFMANKRLNKQELKQMLLVYYLRHKNINIVITKLDVEIDPNMAFRAVSKGVVLLTGSSSLLPEDGRIYNIVGEWEQRDGDWLLIKLDWQ